MLGTQLRPATVEDYPNFLRFFAELGVSDPKPTLEHWCAHMLPTSAFFEQGGSLVGYAFSDIKPPLGYVRHVVIASEHRGQGLGHSLMATLREHLVAHGCTRWCLNVKLSNTSARRLYQRIGMTDRYLTRVVRLAWPLTVRLPTPGANIRARSLGEAEDREVEPHFDLAPGALQARRQRPGTFIATATPNSEPSRYLGLAVFDEAFSKMDGPNQRNLLMTLHVYGHTTSLRNWLAWLRRSAGIHRWRIPAVVTDAEPVQG